MYTSFSIENFRLFDQLTVEPLARVNLIAGQNNAGKTALLEALWLHNLTNPRLAQRLGFWRGISNADSDELFADLFRGYQTGLTIKTFAKGAWSTGMGGQLPLPLPSTFETSLNIHSDKPDGEVEFAYGGSETATTFKVRVWRDEDLDDERNRSRYRLRTKGELPSPYLGPCVLIPAGRSPTNRELSVMFGQVEISGQTESVQEVLRLMEPRLRRLTAVPRSDGTVHIYGDMGVGRIIPVSLMGDGFRRLLNLALSFLEPRNGTICIDEIENGIHYSVMQNVWEAIIRFSQQFNVQIFATTHSYECIVAANNAFNALESDELHLHHLYKRDEQVKSQTYNKDAIETNIEYLWELR